MVVNQPHFSAVVVSFHTGPVLDQCLDALIDAPLCRQIVLVDNGNRPDVLNSLARRATDQPKLKLLSGHGNIGFGRGCNLGAANASDELLVFVNPDCVIDAATLPVFSDALSQHPAALVGGALRNEDGSEQRGCRRGVLTPWTALISFIGLGSANPNAGIWRDFNRTGEPAPSEIAEMPVVSGALMAMTARTFQQVGGFDPAFHLHVEDVDLCRRVTVGGGRVLYAPHATGLHIGATSQTSGWAVERAKIASFGHYFWKHARSFWDYLGAAAVMPLLALAILGRFQVQRNRSPR